MLEKDAWSKLCPEMSGTIVVDGRPEFHEVLCVGSHCACWGCYEWTSVSKHRVDLPLPNGFKEIDGWVATDKTEIIGPNEFRIYHRLNNKGEGDCGYKAKDLEVNL